MTGDIGAISRQTKGSAVERQIIPLVGVPCCAREMNGHPFHVVGDKYVRAVVDGAGALPLAIPALGRALDLTDLAGRLDGLLVTGSPSNVEPHHYQGTPSREGTLHDAARDETTLPLIRAALGADLPVLAICRGIQELNVALGGSLHQNVHEVPGREDHRSRKDLSVAARYAHDQHRVSLAPDGVLCGIAGTDEVWVNSLHAQGIDMLAPGLAVEAVAPDGQVEAVRVAGKRFAIGVQWHPEYQVLRHGFSRALFAAFGEALLARARRRALAPV
jgi:putative glutamine amidotransferase